MAIQALSARGFRKVHQGGGSAAELDKYCDIFKVANTIVVRPGLMVSTLGATDGEVIVGVAADLDQNMIVIEEVPSAAKPEPGDIDDTITGATAAPRYVKCARKAGGKFKMACFRTDESTATERLEAAYSAASGYVKKTAFNAAGGTNITETTIGKLGNFAEALADVAGTDAATIIWW